MQNYRLHHVGTDITMLISTLQTPLKEFLFGQHSRLCSTKTLIYDVGTKYFALDAAYIYELQKLFSFYSKAYISKDLGYACQ